MAPTMKTSFTLLATTLFAILALTTSIAARSSPTYTIVSGDTLWEISRRENVDLHAIIDANPQINNPNAIYPGMEINIPHGATTEPPSTRGRRVSQAKEVISLVNTERRKHGLRPLKENTRLSRVALMKAKDMRDNKYFDHVSPTLGKHQDLVDEHGIDGLVGENIAGGQTSARAVVRSWMKSPGHRANILKADYTETGVGFAKGGPNGYYWSQMFLRE